MPEHQDPELEASTQKWMWSGVVLMGLFVLAFPLYRIYEPGARTEARERQMEALATEGQNLFVDNCSECHGEQGQGVDAPALNSRQFLDNVTQDQIDSLIAHGIPGSGMVAWSVDFDGPLTSEQIRAISTYLVSLREDAPDRPDWREPGGDHSSEEESDHSG
ncbi:MAG TPA: c-type cytochrome [Acidimicrobiia bacterium]|nr:c-type cytochrome [Acidimicrobiia bacterium]